jgi:hypothetical protein
MRRFKFIPRQMPCMAGALLLALLPLFHGLHLASCGKKELSCHIQQPIEHSHFGYHCFHHNEHPFKGSECCRAQISGPRDVMGHRHDPSTCPFCQVFTQLMHAAGCNPSQPIQFSEQIQIWAFCPNQVVLKICFFSRAYPRAPPV